MILNSKKGFIAPILSILLLSVMFNFIAAPLAFAADTPATPTVIKTADEKAILEKGGNFSGNLLLWGLNMVLTGVLLFLGQFTMLAGSFFDGSVFFATRHLRDINAVGIGWELSRNVANLFFILILLGIAVATILRVQSYNAKQLLPKLIVIALLINFSLSIGFVIIDAANILGASFHGALLKASNNQGISGAVLAGTKFSNLFNTEDAPGGPQLLRNGMIGFLAGGTGTAIAACTIGGFATLLGCLGAGIAGGVAVASYTTFKSLTGGDGIKDAVQYFEVIMLPLIFSLPLIFVFLVGGFFLISRFVILVLLLILAPIAFLFYILPETEPYWKKWWSTLINQSFFFPSFMFLLYISIGVINQISTNVIAGAIQGRWDFLINLSAAVILLLTSLLLARTMGIYFADTIMSTAHGVRRWLTGFVGGVAARNLVAPVGERLKPLAARITTASPWLGWYARGAQEWLAKRGGAREIGEDQAKAALAQAKPTWGESFRKGTLPMRTAMLRNMDEKQRGEFLANLPQALRTAADNIITSPQFTSTEQKGLAKSRMQYEINQEQLKGNLGGFMAGKSNEDAQKYFGAMSENQKVALLEEWHGTPTTLDKFATLTTAPSGPEGGLSLEDQEKFRQSLKSVSGEAAFAYINSDKLAGDTKEKTLKALSPSQLAYMYTKTTANSAADADRRKEFDSLTKTLAPDVQQQYHRAVAQALDKKSPEELNKIFPLLSDGPDGIATEWVRSHKAEENIALINDPATPAPVRDKILKNIKATGRGAEYTKKLDIPTKIKYLDYDDPAKADKDPNQFTRDIEIEVKNSTARELAQRTSAKIIRDTNFKESLLKGANIMQLASLTDTPEKSAALKEILSEAVDKDFSADNIAKKFKAKNLSIQLGEQLANLRRKQKEMMNQPERLLYSQIFGDL